MEIYEACEYYKQQLEAAKQKIKEQQEYIVQLESVSCTEAELSTECERLLFENSRMNKTIESANQRELELLAVIESIKDVIYKAEIHSGMLRIREALNIKPSEALREHEAKVIEQAIYELDDLFTAYPSEHDESIKVCQNVLRRMAEERRKE